MAGRNGRVGRALTLAVTVAVLLQCVVPALSLSVAPPHSHTKGSTLPNREAVFMLHKGGRTLLYSDQTVASIDPAFLNYDSFSGSGHWKVYSGAGLTGTMTAVTFPTNATGLKNITSLQPEKQGLMELDATTYTGSVPLTANATVGTITVTSGVWLLFPEAGWKGKSQEYSITTANVTLTSPVQSVWCESRYDLPGFRFVTDDRALYLVVDNTTHLLNGREVVELMGLNRTNAVYEDVSVLKQGQEWGVQYGQLVASEVEPSVLYLLDSRQHKKRLFQDMDGTAPFVVLDKHLFNFIQTGLDCSCVATQDCYYELSFCF